MGSLPSKEVSTRRVFWFKTWAARLGVVLGLLFLAFGVLGSMGMLQANELPEEWRPKSKEAKAVLVEFSAKWCSTCQFMKPYVAQLVKDSGTKLSYVYVDLSGFDNMDKAVRFNIQVTPTYLLFEPSGSLLNRLEGGDPEVLEDTVTKAIK
ncbi:MAG: thioredoxin family protein [Cyanobacteria bacterium]|nr:thioredoxin family protein [Cyanobacteriota bacterium]